MPILGKYSSIIYLIFRILSCGRYYSQNLSALPFFESLLHMLSSLKASLLVIAYRDMCFVKKWLIFLGISLQINIHIL